MVVREMKLGDGTLQFQGEAPEFWERKTAHFQRGRFLITLGLAIVGLLVLAYAASPFSGHATNGTVQRIVATNASDQNMTVLVSYVDEGTAKTAKVVVGASPSLVAGQSIALFLRYNGTVSPGDSTTDDAFWVIGSVLLLVALARESWAFLRRGKQIRFVGPSPHVTA